MTKYCFKIVQNFLSYMLVYTEHKQMEVILRWCLSTFIKLFTLFVVPDSPEFLRDLQFFWKHFPRRGYFPWSRNSSGHWRGSQISSLRSNVRPKSKHLYRDSDPEVGWVDLWRIPKNSYCNMRVLSPTHTLISQCMTNNKHAWLAHEYTTPRWDPGAPKLD